MNERINDLFDKALDEVVPNTWTNLTMDQLNDIKNKFAELIIRECVNQAHGVADLRGVNDDMVYGADTAAVRIHRYFGV